MNTLESLRRWATIQEKAKSNPRIAATANEQILFCIQYMYYCPDGVWRIQDENLHARSGLQAGEDFYNSLKPGERKRCKVIAVAPVVGYLVDDKHGDLLTV